MRAMRWTGSSVWQSGCAIRTVAYDALLLDLHLPDGKGLDFLRALRARRDMLPVVILTARDQVSDRIEGLTAGADDYLVKPFDLDELNARLNAVARRYFGTTTRAQQFGPVQIELEARQAQLEGVEVTADGEGMGGAGGAVRRPNAIVSREQIEDALYAFAQEIESNAIEVYISRIRRKLGRDFVRTVRGLGYRIRS